ncbi:MAG TPA: penicillin acylase family protein [Acidimicrobiia bacterium]
MITAMTGVVSFAGSAGGATPAPLPSETPDNANTALTILPPGNGYLDGQTSGNADDQAGMYDHLDDPVADHKLTDADLSKYFKNETLAQKAGLKDRTEDLNSTGHNVVIRWDSFGVPHVHGKTAEDVAYGGGYATAEARYLILELARFFGRTGLLETAGGGDGILQVITHLDTLPRVNYSEQELQKSIDDALAAAPPGQGPKIKSALDSYLGGINHWYVGHQQTAPLLKLLGFTDPKPWTETDVVAAGIAVDDIFGAGGGDEVGNARALEALQSKFGTGTGKALYDDLRMPDDPNKATTIPGNFPYPLFSDGASAAHAVDPNAVAMVDPQTTTMVQGFQQPALPHASNHLVLAASRSKSHHPIMVGGPQSAYFFPQLLFEMELQGGGYKASGITFPGIGPWIVIGHSTNYAWTATSGNSDLVDERIEKLCAPAGTAVTKDTHAYVFNGQCVPMTKPDGDAQTMWRTVHGPVIGTATVKGAPVAIARQRASRNKEADASLAFWTLNHGTVKNASQFASTMSSIPMSFNWSYVNQKDIAYFHSGLYPIRAAGASYDLPTWGTGQWEWPGFVPWQQHPQAVDPPSGEIVSWNNTPARGWQSADNAWGEGAIQRSVLISGRAKNLTNSTPATAVNAVQDAGTADLRGQLVVPEVVATLGNSKPPAGKEYLNEIRTKLAAYAASGAHRRDRNYDYFYDDPMTPVVDNLWQPLLHATFDGSLGTYMTDDNLRRPQSLDNPPAASGSAFDEIGWYTLEWRELRRTRGAEARPAGTPALCGGGGLTKCRADLWGALDVAYQKTRSVQFLGNTNVSQWVGWTVPDRISFLPYIFNSDSMRWVNKPTYQQVMSFGK